MWAGLPGHGADSSHHTAANPMCWEAQRGLQAAGAHCPCALKPLRTHQGHSPWPGMASVPMVIPAGKVLDPGVGISVRQHRGGGWSGREAH